MAIGGDYMSAASFLGIAGIIALYGYDGFLYSIGFLVAWLVALLLVAELMRNSGKYTMADVLAFRMRQRPVRTAAAVSTVTVSIFYLLAQMVGAGALVALLLGIKPGTTFLGMDADTAKIATIILIGALMIIYVTVGGMKGTTYVQIVKAFLLMGGALLMTRAGAVALQVQPLRAARRRRRRKTGKGDAFLEPGLRVRQGGRRQRAADLLQQDGPALARPRAGARHGRPAAHPDPLLHRADGPGRPAQRALGDRHHRHLLPVHPGAGLRRGGPGRRRGDRRPGPGRQHRRAAAGPGAGRASSSAATSAGSTFLAIIAAVAFATILAVVAGPHPGLVVEPGARLLRQRDQEGQGLRAPGGRGRPRSPPSVIGAIAIVLASWPSDLNVAFLVALAFAVAASGNLPAILYSLFWKRFNTTGAVWAIYGGLIAAVVLVVLLPGRLRAPTSHVPARRTGTGSRCPTRASSRSRSASSAAGSARCCRARTNAGQVRRAGGPLPDRRRRALTALPWTPRHGSRPPPGPQPLGQGPGAPATGPFAVAVLCPVRARTRLTVPQQVDDARVK